MVSLAFQAKFSAYLAVASLTLLVWDILDNVKNDYHLLFRHRLGLPTISYFISRISALSWTILFIISSNSPSLDCRAFQTTCIALVIIGISSTMFLCYLRVCAVWHWNRFIVGFFGVSWLSVVTLSFTLICSIKTVQVEDYCTTTIVKGPLILAPFIATVFNQTIVFLAITYGVCKNTLGGDLTFRDGILLMLGKSLPTFSKAMLHDSQVCYIIIMGISAITLAWVYGWPEIQVEHTSSFRLALVAPYLALVTILTCRVHRNTKLGLYSKVQSNNSKSQTHAATYGIAPSNSYPAVIPIQIAVTHVEEYRSDYPTTKSQCSAKSLDFGMV